MTAATLARRNPSAKLIAAMLLTLCLVVSLDPVTGAVALAVELAVVPAFGFGYRQLLRRLWPLLLASLAAASSYLLFTERSGEVVWSLGPLLVTQPALISGASLVLRLLAVALPGIAVFATTDVTELADSFVQNLRLPARFVIAAVAAMRLLPLLTADWQMLRLARRARGISAGLNPVAHVRLFGSGVFGLLVLAVRRGTALARAMDARGFDSSIRRGVARPQPFRPADVALVLSGGLIGALALAASIAARTFNPVFF
jgi:energy-coupling factor transport system permease protein